MSDLVYIYAVVPSTARRLTELHGIGGRTVRAVVLEDLAAIVSDVPAEEFEETPLNEHVRDMGWLGPRAVAHQEVNYRLHESVEAMIPLAFGTVFRDDERVRQLLRDQAVPLTDRLAMVRGCAEWVVALHQLAEPDAEVVAQASAMVRDLSKEIETSPPGRAHLLRRRLAALERDEARRLRGEAAEKVLAAVREVAQDVFAEPLPTDTIERPLLRASVLVRRSEEPRFLDVVEALKERWPEPGYRLLLTGPWPPYRFGGLPTADG